jgi:hypothetical protein
MIRYVRYTSIFANLVFVAFLGCLIYDTARTMRVVHELNPLWFVLGVIAIIALAAIVAEWRSEHDGPRPPGPGPEADGSGPAKELAGQTGGGR